MKKAHLDKAIRLFELFRRHRISDEDLVKAESKSAYLDEKVEEFRLLISMSKDVIAGRYHMNKWNLSIIIATIAYVISPLDAVPDVLPLMGWMDDVTIVTYAVSKLTEEIKKYKAFTQARLAG
ncbi:YkvA family protein [Parapedobacter sp. GCM10030251]|uniref:YkvA family protein n=1 Tax=Parapedobacter sp. GCM10030251 TaxID=3273419 RepID=UPI00361E3131